AQLGSMGDTSVLDELEASLQITDEAAYQDMARAAIAAINQRAQADGEDLNATDGAAAERAAPPAGADVNGTN
ncbi:MAG: hypothetical protein WD873_05930, partial [Candidatus Hydrogenedentales bacterium]